MKNYATFIYYTSEKEAEYEKESAKLIEFQL